MSFYRYLVQVMANQCDLTYREWQAKEQHSASLKELAEKQWEAERLAQQAIYEEKRNLDKERLRLKKEHRAALAWQKLEEERQELYQKPGTYSRLREFVAERDSLKRQISEKASDVGKELDLETLRSRLANVEVQIREARLGPKEPSQEPKKTPVTPYLNEKEIESMALKAFTRFNRLPDRERAGAVSEWQAELINKYGPLIAGEIAGQYGKISIPHS